MVKLTLKRSEADVKRSVCELLKARGIMTFRMNSGSNFASYKGRIRKIAGHPAGTADILCFFNWNQFKNKNFYHQGRVVLWLELKSSTGKQSPEQKQFQQMVEAEGHTYLLVRSAEEVERWLRDNT